MRALQLSGFRFVELRAGDLEGLVELRDLSINETAIARFPTGIFAPLIKLEYLNVFDNALRDIEPFIFGAGLSHLREIEFDGNNIRHLPKNSFNDLPRLEQLDLSENRIKSVDEGAFVNLPNLVELNMSDNLLEELNSSVFSGLAHLVDANFNHNPIKYISAGTFFGLEAMKRLQIRDHGLLDIQPSTFRGLTSVECLDLVSFHKFGNIAPNSFHELSKLKKVAFKEGQLTDEQLKVLKIELGDKLALVSQWIAPCARP